MNALTLHCPAWAGPQPFFQTEVVQEISRISDHKGFYTNLSIPRGISLVEFPNVPIKRVEWPVDKVKWMHLGAPRDATVITINEADALVWSIVDRLRRPNELRSRILTGTDSAACCGAIAKGRSRSRRLNARYRQIAAALFCGRIELFLSWLSTHINPADEPSRWWEEVRKAKEAFGIDVPVVVPRTPAAWAAPQYFALLLCGGRARDGDVRDWI